METVKESSESMERDDEPFPSVTVSMSLPLTPASLGVGLSLFTLPTRDSVTRGRLRRVGNRSERVTKERGTEGDRGESPGTPRDRDAERK